MQKISLTPRLAAVSSLVSGGFVADVGTDHAYLPIYLVETGAAFRAVASDIRREPLARARENIEAAGLSDKIETVSANGLNGLEKYPITDVVIAGMGGMTVIDILNASDFIKKNRTHLILQPVQNAEELCVYLYENGFFIDREATVIDNGRVYRVISASYDGKKRDISPLSAALGEYNIAHKRENAAGFSALCDKKIKLLTARVAGLERSGQSSAAERELLEQIKKERSEI